MMQGINQTDAGPLEFQWIVQPSGTDALYFNGLWL